MLSAYKQIYEIDHVKVKDRIEEVQNFISISRNFSIKVQSHIKILVHLVNNLIESDDNLELVETPLKMPDLSSLKKKSKTKDSNNQTRTDEANQSEPKQHKIFDKILSNFQNENERLWKYVQKGEEDTKFLKNCFEKMIENMSQKDRSVMNDLPGQKIVNRIQCPHQHQPHFNMSHYPGTNPNNPNNDQNKFHSVYIPHNRREDEQMNSVKSLKNEIGKMNKEIKRLSDHKEDKGLQEMVKKLIEVKSENEELLRKKERENEELQKDLQDAGRKAKGLEKALKDLIDNNRLLEEKVREMMTNRETSSNSEKDQSEFDDLKNSNRLLQKKLENIESTLRSQNKKNISKENKKLKNELNKLENENEGLKERIERLNKYKEIREESNKKRRVDRNVIDLLKCVFIQAQSVEIELTNRQSYFS